MNSNGADINTCSANRKEYVWRILVTVGITMAALLLLAMLWFALDILLLMFAGGLLAVLLRAPADWIAAHSPIRPGWAVGFVIIAIALILGIGGRFVAAPVTTQLRSLITALPQMTENARQKLLTLPLGERLVRDAESINWSSRRVNAFGKITGAVSTAFGLITSVGVILFLGLFFAAQPSPYLNGFVRLFPMHLRARTREVLQAVGHALRRWLLGQLCSMTIIGILTGAGLWLLGIPFALALGIVAAILSFIPYLGPIISALPAVLLAFTQGPRQALYAGLLYLGVQVVESNVLTPLIQQQAIRLPPAMILFTQIVLGATVGGLGIVLATPVAAMGLVLVQMLYLEDFLGEKLQ